MCNDLDNLIVQHIDFVDHISFLRSTTKFVAVPISVDDKIISDVYTVYNIQNV